MTGANCDMHAKGATVYINGDVIQEDIYFDIMRLKLKVRHGKEYSHPHKGLSILYFSHNTTAKKLKNPLTIDRYRRRSMRMNNEKMMSRCGFYTESHCNH